MSNFADVRPVGAALSTCAQTDRRGGWQR